MNRVRYSLVESVTVKDSKGNATKQFKDVGYFYGSYIAPVTQGKSVEYGFNGETTAKLVSRKLIPVNSYVKHQQETYHVLGILSTRDIHTVLLKKV